MSLESYVIFQIYFSNPFETYSHMLLLYRMVNTALVVGLSAHTRRPSATLKNIGGVQFHGSRSVICQLASARMLQRVSYVLRQLFGETYFRW